MDVIQKRKQKKQTGSFYSPSVLAHFVASKIQSLIHSSNGCTILDPAVGDGELLVAMRDVRNCDGDIFVGVDIDETALISSSERLPKGSLLIQTNALAPFGKYKDGWDTIKQKIANHSFDIIISNPPWGAEIDLNIIETEQFDTAKGQFDIYDLFIETSLDLLDEGGVYGFILPDSVFRHEHYQIREKLLKETSISYIVRIGEFFFDGVNTPVSVIIGTKGYKHSNSVSCMNISNKNSKQILSGCLTFEALENAICHSRIQESFIADSCCLTIDILSEDEQLVNKLETGQHLRDVLTSHRGVELSKKGDIIKCPFCGKWMPQPKSNKLNTKCGFCGSDFSIAESEKEKIIKPHSEVSDNLMLPFIAGEDMERYNFKVSRRIKLGYDGINYKKLNLYKGPKIIVRKTGVGITACLDYGNNIVNQVVYILELKTDVKKIIPIEFCIALLNSRLTTYYIIKKYSSTKWCTHPYLSQEMVMSLPFPDYKEFGDKDWEKVYEISNIVSKTYHSGHGKISKEDDAKIERFIFDIFRFDKKHFTIILNAIQSVEQLIPFKRLLNISEELWDTVI